MKPLAFSLLLAACSHPATPDVPLTGSVQVDPALPGLAVPDDFLGISLEWWELPMLLGDGNGGLQPTSLQLLRNFSGEGHRLSVRLGGNSEDQAWWNPSGAPRPPNVTIDLVPSELATLAALHGALESNFILGLNLALDDAANASQLITAALSVLPGDSLDFELGNEPDRFDSIGVRPSPYDWPAYRSDLEQFHDAIATDLPSSVRFAGPALASRAWLPSLLAALPDETTRLSLITTHAYAFPGCAGSTRPAPIDLLSENATTNLAKRFVPVAAAAHAAGFRHRMAEMNSISCGGAPGVSDVYASALWGADVAFELAAAGLDGINFHTTGDYAVWDYAVHPLYYGLRLFSLATARSGRWLPVQVSSSSRVRAWATLGSDGATRVALINEDPITGETIGLAISGRNGGASAIRLSAPALDATTGVTLGGQTWDGSTDGNPTGKSQREILRRQDGAWVVSLPALQAVVVTAP